MATKGERYNENTTARIRASLKIGSIEEPIEKRNLKLYDHLIDLNN